MNDLGEKSVDSSEALALFSEDRVQAFVDLRAQWIDHAPDSPVSDERMFDPSGVQPGVAGSRF